MSVIVESGAWHGCRILYQSPRGTPVPFDGYKGYLVSHGTVGVSMDPKFNPPYLGNHCWWKIGSGLILLLEAFVLKEVMRLLPVGWVENEL